jgi:hypothetical protein
MIKLTWSLFVLFLTFPAPSFAYQYQLDYSGYVTYSNNPTYSENDFVIGSLYLDLGKGVNIATDPNSVEYSSRSAHDYITGFYPPGAGVNNDIVFTYNGVNPSTTPAWNSRDVVSIVDSHVDYVQRWFNTFQIILDLNRDWMTEPYLKEFEFYASELNPLPINDAQGVINNVNMDDWSSKQTRFKLNHVKLFSVQVYEPSSFLLLVVGICVIFLRRARKWRSFGN